ncbi:helix-turn-helix transcriptional regulator [Streptomyces pristinaespiralis]|nr:LuxR C-terminal-related transcriptional regulator [Streptomyces pristinaespiralis]
MDFVEFRADLRTSVFQRQLAPIPRLQRALAELRTASSVEDAVRRGPEVACRSCGFSGAVLVQVEGREVVPAGAWAARDPDFFAKVSRRLVGDDGRPLTFENLSMEREMMRRRRPVLVRDAMNDNRPGQELRRMAGVRSYVAAPILPEGRVLGFMYAFHSEDRLDIVDRDVLGTFTEGYGYALERAILRSRLRTQVQLYGELVEAAKRQLDAVGSAGLTLLGPADCTPAAPEPEFVRVAPPTPSALALLSRREIEVMELLAGGATNRVIAARLVVAESTAKAHVAQILRKLEARNRAEAVTKYLRLLHTT